jgi:hypothetical protein
MSMSSLNDLAPARDDDAQPDQTDDPLAAGEAEHACRRLLLAVATAPAADRGAHGQNRQREENHHLEGGGDALAQLLLLVGDVAVAPDRLAQPPQPDGDEAHDDDPQQDLAEGVVGQLLERALLVRLLTAAATERDLQREPRDQEVRDAVTGEADPSPDLDGPAVGDALGGGVRRMGGVLGGRAGRSGGAGHGAE